MYGESLGARVAQEALSSQPRSVDDGGRVQGVDAVVSVGTPVGLACATSSGAAPMWCTSTAGSR